MQQIISVGKFYEKSLKLFRVLLGGALFFFTVFFLFLMYLNFEVWQIGIYLVLVWIIVVAYFIAIRGIPLKIKIDGKNLYFLNGAEKPLKFGGQINQYEYINLCKLRLPIINIKAEYYNYALENNIKTELIFCESGNANKKIIIGHGGVLGAKSLIPMKEAIEIEKWIKEQKEKICEGN